MSEIDVVVVNRVHALCLHTTVHIQWEGWLPKHNQLHLETGKNKEAHTESHESERNY